MMTTPRTELTEETPADSVNSEADNGSQKSAKDWLSLLPEHWDLARLKFLCRRSAIYGANIPASEYVSDGVRFLRTTDIDDRGNLTEDDPVFVERAPIEDYLLSDGDVLLSRSGTLGRSFLYRSSRHGECAYAGYLVRFVPGELLNPKFLFFYTKSAGFKVWLARETIESTIGNVSGRKFASLPVPLPPTPEQENITRFVESRTRRIDDLIAKKQRLIELLAEKRTALITQAVTKGLDPDVPMKDSGVEWLGEIPKHWETPRLGQLSTRLVPGPFGSALTKDVYGGNTYRVYGQEQVIPDDFSVGDYYIPEAKYHELRRFAVDPGDLLISCVGTYGKAAVVPMDAEPGVINPRLIRVVLNRNVVRPVYLQNFFRSIFAKAQLDSLSRGGTMDVLNATLLSQVRVPLPPMNEQKAIERTISNAQRSIAATVDAVSEAANLLQEYRSALITAAVTGKIDVRDRAA